MLDTHQNIPGVLLAGCHETQFNVKVAPGGQDPWTWAILGAVEGMDMPTYQQLFDDARARIESELADGTTRQGGYLGPSLDPAHPVP
ncbi:hypothetical protein AOQ84DRAFT_357780 [Glonium stellatum]|uniref:Uncharacterized protein n=1 Tax=Glonium stellatum TaxID=574774 RepID=A0A8E2EN31_9PEZI|nr:hypothetical protein AOQ84DRAFT_357780 [Glonium stellatum]